MKIKVSIIIPVYNVEKFLDQCLQSVVGQTLKDIEIILVDDESPDSCPQKCEEWAQKDNRIKVIHKQNGGLGFARNSGIELAKGKYVAFVDSDDFIDKETYEIAYNIANENNLDSIRFAKDRYIDGTYYSSIKSADVSIITDPELIKEGALFAFDKPSHDERFKYFEGGNGSSCCGLFRLSTINEHHIRFHSEKELISEDFVFGFDFAMKAKRIGYINKTFYHYRYNTYSLTHTVRLDRAEKALYYSNYMSERITNEGFDSDAQTFPMGYYISMLIVSLSQVFLANMSIYDKRKWFLEQLSNKYIDEIKLEYPSKRLSLRPRLFYRLIINKNFYLSYAIVYLFDKVKQFKLVYYRHKSSGRKV